MLVSHKSGAGAGLHQSPIHKREELASIGLLFYLALVLFHLWPELGAASAGCVVVIKTAAKVTISFHFSAPYKAFS